MAPCLHCGRPKPSNAPFGLCAACLLSSALATPADGPHYQTVSLIAEDAGASVYLAQTSTPGYIALKVLTCCDDADAVMARFAQWKPALLSLRHPHIAPIVDAGVTDQGAVYVASRYVGGSALAAVAARQSVSAADRAELGRQLSDAVAAMHSAGLVHLKLDASKVKVSVSGSIHLTVLGVGSALVLDGVNGPPDADRAAVVRIASDLGLHRL